MTEKKRKGRTVTMVLSQEDYHNLRKKYEASTCCTFSQFLRDTAFHKPIRTIYREQAIEDFLEVAVDIRNGLDTLLKQLTPPAGTSSPDLPIIRQQMEEIKFTMHKIYKQCTSTSPRPKASAPNSATTKRK